jgi:hypothetical protein
MNRRDFLKTGGAAAAAAALAGCAALSQPGRWWTLSPENPLAAEAADTIGYGLGLFAAKDPAMRMRIENYYAQIKGGDVTPAVASAALSALAVEGPEYKFFAHKIFRWLKLLGAEIAADGSVLSLGRIDPELIAAGKDGYLAALAISS